MVDRPLKGECNPQATVRSNEMLIEKMLQGCHGERRYITLQKGNSPMLRNRVTADGGSGGGVDAAQKGGLLAFLGGVRFFSRSIQNSPALINPTLKPLRIQSREPNNTDSP